MTTRLWEGLSGVLAALWGLLVEGYLLFGPFYSYAHGTIGGPTTTGHTGLVGTGIPPATAISLSLLAVFLIGIAVTAIVDSRGSKLPVVRVFLLVTTVLLILYSCAAIASIGVLLIPSVVLALIASILAARSDGGRARHPQSSA